MPSTPPPSPLPNAWWLSLAVVTAHCGVALWFVAGRSTGTDAALTGFPIDDAWIHMVYGRAVAETGLPHYNPGQLETGFTSPLWMLLLAAAHWLAQAAGWAPWAVAKACGVALGAVTASLVLHLTWQLTRNVAAAACAGILAALSPHAVFAGLSGMEVTLSSCAALAALLAYCRGRPALTGLALAAGVASRPEGLLLVAVLAVAEVVRRRTATGTERIRAAAALCAPSLAVVVSWSLYCMVATGRPLPSTFYAKLEAAGDGRTLAALIDVARMLPAHTYGAGLLLLGAAMAGAARHRLRVEHAVVLAYPWLFCLAVAQTRSLPEPFADHFYWWRYFAPALPIVAAGTGLGIAALLRAGEPAHLPRRVAAAAGAALALASLTPHAPALASSRDRFASDCQNIEEVQVGLGHWLAARPHGDGAAVNDAGAIRYFGKRPVLDLIGLNCAELLTPGAGTVYADPGSLRLQMRLAGLRYLIVFPGWFRELVDHPEFAAVFRPRLRHHSPEYTVAPQDSGQDTMWVFELRATPAAPR